ncbi:hypothetical protein [Acetobacter cibinongensis]|nr:hypothetical protein [Acetobacter cibinongensis]
MTSSTRIMLATLALSCATALSAPAAHALTSKECHQNYTAARKAGTVTGQSYKEYKAASCDAAAATTDAATKAPAADTPATAPKAEKPTVATTPAATAPAAAPKSAAPAASTAGVVFPSAVADQYSKLSAGKARMKTCLDQYNANKEKGGNGSLKWIQKGGGYYSQCNTRLKGE